MSESEAQEFLENLAEEGRYVAMAQPVGNQFEVQWIEQKNYTAIDGKEFPDEVWVTKEGEMKLIQDLEAEHARNVIRMLIRRQREISEIVHQAMDDLASGAISLSEEDSPYDDRFDSYSDIKPTLH